MAVVPTNSNHNIRLGPDAAEDAPPLEAKDITVEHDDEEEDKPELDSKGNVIKIEHGDGSVTISLNGGPVEKAQDPDTSPKGWFDNIADDISEQELGSIAENLLRGVADDIESRREWIETRAVGLKLLGLELEIPNTSGETEGAPVEGISRVRHPLLLEAVLRFQANARSELLPTDGPVKIRNDSNNITEQQEELADALEKDNNHYLTVTATEYYPDTDRMLLMLGFGGTAFKKGYNCPLRNRPVLETVDANDLIVSNTATDLKNALRVTHRMVLKQSVIKRMQIIGAWRDIDVSSTPVPVQKNAVDLQKEQQQGVTTNPRNPNDRDREIYECYCELDIPGFEHKHKGKPSGLPIPYVVTIDVSTKKVLAVVRNYDEATKELPEARTVFIKYTFVPGIGFYDIGLLHILGNTTNAVTAAWRELLDSGMFATFPGFLMADTGARQATNIFRIPPGGGALVKTGGMPIKDAVMPVPYNNQGAPALMDLVKDMTTMGQRLGGTAEQAVGEGKQDAPVGTTLALIDQAQKMLNAVHKRMHASQAEEFQLLKRLFKENPEAFWQFNRQKAYPWDEATFQAALKDVNLVPQADPNTASHTQRVIKVVGLKQLQSSAPGMYNGRAVEEASLKALGWDNPEQFLVPEGTPPAPNADDEVKKSQAEKNRAEAKATLANAVSTGKKADAEVQEKIAGLGAANMDGQFGPTQQELDLENKKLDIEAAKNVTDTHLGIIDADQRERDRMVELAVNTAKLANERHKHDTTIAHQTQVHEETHEQRDAHHKADTEVKKLQAKKAAKPVAKPKAKK